MNKPSYDQILSIARDYLLEVVSEEVLERHLEAGEAARVRGLESMNMLFRRALESMINRQGIENALGPVKNLDKYLFDFDPKKIYEEYGKDWQRLFLEIQKEYQPPSRMDIKKSRSYWVKYIKGIISSAEFFSQFNSVEAFHEYVRHFYNKEETRAALPLMMAKEIYWYGFALSCDFLKENGYPEYVKPDVHIKDILQGLDIISSRRDDYEAYKELIKFARAVEKTPYAVDKMLWLIGSNNYYLANPDEIPIKKTSKEEFLIRVKRWRAP